MPPQPREAPQPPPTARADRMVFMVGSKPDDTNNNGFPDSIKATVVLFSSQHPTSIRQDGAFVFTLFQQGRSDVADVKPLATWRIDGGVLARSLAHAQYGPCYKFQLSLLEAGGDRHPLDRADLICRFEPADGLPAVLSDGVRTIQIGRRLAANTVH